MHSRTHKECSPYGDEERAQTDNTVTPVTPAGVLQDCDILSEPLFQLGGAQLLVLKTLLQTSVIFFSVCPPLL